MQPYDSNLDSRMHMRPTCINKSDNESGMLIICINLYRKQTGYVRRFTIVNIWNDYADIVS